MQGNKVMVMKKKILFVMMSLYNGGAEKSLVNLLNELPEDKYDIDLLLFKKEGLYLSQLPSNVNVLEVPPALSRLYIGKSRERIIGTVIARMLCGKTGKAGAYRWKYFYSKHIGNLSGKYDVALAYTSNEILYYVYEKISADKKIVWIHNDYVAARHPKDYDYPHLKNMDAIVTISDKCADILKEVFPEFTDKIYNIPNITSSTILQRRAQEFYPDEYKTLGGPCILSIGRLHPQKGFDMAISAAALLKRQGIRFKWFVIGDGPLEKALKKQIHRECVEDCFFLLGVRENPYPYIKNCDFVVQSSRYEGKSVVLDEAKILSKPIVATAYPTVKDQVENGKEGIVVEMSPNGIAEGVKTMISNETLRKNIEQYLMQHEYGNQNEIDKYIALIG